jgi:hypothetical protein
MRIETRSLGAAQRERGRSTVNGHLRNKIGWWICRLINKAGRNAMQHTIDQNAMCKVQDKSGARTIHIPSGVLRANTKMFSRAG